MYSILFVCCRAKNTVYLSVYKTINLTDGQTDWQQSDHFRVPSSSFEIRNPKKYYNYTLREIYDCLSLKKK